MAISKCVGGSGILGFEVVFCLQHQQHRCESLVWHMGYLHIAFLQQLTFNKELAGFLVTFMLTNLPKNVVMR
jgi:hypothetical protein